MNRYIWQGPGNLSVSSRMIAPGEEIVFDAAGFANVDADVKDRLVPVVDDVQAEPDDEAPVAAAGYKRKSKRG